MKKKYSRKIIEAIRLESDLVVIASEFLVLKKIGRWNSDYISLCPFHNEKHPSFRIVTQRQFFHCFGCSSSGDIFDFVMRINGFNFIESIEYLGKRVRIL
jgi:DNA primase